jgi:hypothetical protein
MRRVSIIYSVFLLSSMGILALTGPAILGGAGGPEADLILRVCGVLLLLAALWRLFRGFRTQPTEQ